MAVINDSLVVIFSTRGVQGAVSAHMTLAKAQLALANAQDAVAVSQRKVVNAYQQMGPKQQKQAVQDHKDAIEELEQAQFQLFSSYMSQAKTAAYATAIWAASIYKMTSSYVAFGNEVMNIKALTGASAGDSVTAAIMQRATGVGDVQEMRELLRAGRAMFDSRGQAALGRMGIAANPNQTGLNLVNQIADRLQEMPDSLQKTRDMEDIFGQRGVAAMLPLLRLTKAQRQEMSDLAGTFDAQAIPAIQDFQYQAGMLGQTFEQRIIFPIAEQMLPVLSSLISFLRRVFNVLGTINDVFHGVPAWITGMVALSVGVMMVFRTVMMLVNAYKALAATETFAAVMAGDVTALARVAVATAGAAAVIYGVNKAIASSESDSKSANVGALDRNTEAVNRLGDSFNEAKGRGNGIPIGMESGDAAALWRRGALKTIG